MEEGTQDVLTQFFPFMYFVGYRIRPMAWPFVWILDFAHLLSLILCFTILWVAEKRVSCNTESMKEKREWEILAPEGM